MKLWAGRFSKEADSRVNDFNSSISFDCRMIKEDIEGSVAHARMLGECGIVEPAEADKIAEGLKGILADVESGRLPVDPDAEDIHMFVEAELTRRLGDTGKRLHTARSRNDQVLVDVKLFLRSELEKTVLSVQSFFDLLVTQSEKFKTHLLPGYTHLQLAMPSSFGLWFGAYAESLVDDLITLQSAYKIVNKNPLGSAAGYGSSFPIS